jgi:hypothetical protein
MFSLRECQGRGCSLERLLPRKRLALRGPAGQDIDIRKAAAIRKHIIVTMSDFFVKVFMG